MMYDTIIPLHSEVMPKDGVGCYADYEKIASQLF